MHEILKEITIMKNGVPKKYIIPDYSEELNELKSGMTNKANINHVHGEYADKNHMHKEFYTKNEIDNKLSEMQTGGGGATNLENYITKAEAAEKFAPRTHNHTEFARLNHTHTGYALESHTHTGFANKEHNHNSDYYTKEEVDTMISRINAGSGGIDINDITAHVPYATCTKNGSIYSATITGLTAYVAGMGIAIKIPSTPLTTGNATINVNNLGSKVIKKSGGTTVTNNILKANGIYTLRYDGSAFILQGEGGEYGTATGEQVLEGYTIGTNNGVIDGTIPTRTGGTVIPTTTTQTKAAGYYSDAIIIQGSPNLTAPNIKKGVNIFGVVGTYSAQPDEPTSFTQSINLKKTSPSSATISGGGDAIQYIYYVDVTLATTKTVTFSFSKKSSQTVYIDGTKGVGQHHAGINGNTITVDMTSAANYAAQSGSGSQYIKGYISFSLVVKESGYYDSRVNVIINAW